MKKHTIPAALAALSLAAVLASCGETVPEAGPASIVVATDLHYTGQAVEDGGALFQQVVEYGDGRQLDYIRPITDAFLAEVLAQKPDALVLTGDVSLNGEKASHEELAAKLQPLVEAGIRVYVLPGNHDINNYAAYRYEGEGRERTESVTAEEFETIYKNCGFAAAASRDKASLSYMVKLNRSVWLFMLDAEQYAEQSPGLPYFVGGKLQEKTYQWLEKQLKACQKAGATPLVALHQNLTDHSAVFSSGYTLFENDRLGALLQQYGVQVTLSGHLHIQDISPWQGKKGEPVWDIAGESLAVWPYQYGILEVEPGPQGAAYRYRTRETDLTAWAAAAGLTDPVFADFSAWGREQFAHNSTTRGQEETLAALGAEAGGAKLRLMAELNPAYFAGALTEADAAAVRGGKDYALVGQAAAERGVKDPLGYIDSILEAAGKENRELTIP
ncbi:metallophosphoesterase family protein [Allofournierella sp.]|uniref:metallophosphoesterase family protein n=1 Tax=Allofournierella sp. TaxID=1940256 RepID=UPI003AB5251A